jgi:type IV pilus assembly protein PilE
MKRTKGFTLIEMLVVVGMIAALTALALPAYSKYVDRSRRVEGQALANMVAQRQERFFSTYNKYTSSLTGSGNAGLGMTASPGCGGSICSENGFYTVAVVTSNNDQEFTVTVTPRASTTQDDDKCGSLRLQGSGAKSYTGLETNGKCWN